MRHTFRLIYELDTTVACAVAAYLDAEHYKFLHSKYSPEWEVIDHHDLTIKVRQSWQYGARRVAQVYTCEYVPPATFLNYDMHSDPWWLPSVHHVMKTRTELRYYPTDDGERTVSDLRVDLDLPIFLWPVRKLIESKLCALKREKDDEDMEMIARRAEIYGRGNIKSYLADHQFMLYKDEFVRHFGKADVSRTASVTATSAED